MSDKDNLQEAMNTILERLKEGNDLILQIDSSDNSAPAIQDSLTAFGQIMEQLERPEVNNAVQLANLALELGGFPELERLNMALQPVIDEYLRKLEQRGKE